MKRLNKKKDFHITKPWILSHREKKNEVGYNVPYAYLVEKECMPDGKIEDVATVFLTNNECPFTCLMCDLWKNTTNETVPLGAIPKQLEFALARMSTTRHIKLYNSGNFFDSKAIPPADHGAIIDLLRGFDTVIVENHPKLMDRRVLDFRDQLKTNIQIAIGLETINPFVLPKLNKQMTTTDFRLSVEFLLQNDILSRAFILLRPPFMSEDEGVIWANKSMEFAFEAGVECCVIIPTRSGNGAMDLLKRQGLFHEPSITSLEVVLDFGLALGKGRVFADLWDLERFSSCTQCLEFRKKRMELMNLDQQWHANVACSCSKD